MRQESVTIVLVKNSHVPLTVVQVQIGNGDRSEQRVRGHGRKSRVELGSEESDGGREDEGWASVNAFGLLAERLQWRE